MCGIMCVGLQGGVNLHAWLPALPGIRTSSCGVGADDAAKARGRELLTPLCVGSSRISATSAPGLCLRSEPAMSYGSQQSLGASDLQDPSKSSKEGYSHVPS